MRLTEKENFTLAEFASYTEFIDIANKGIKTCKAHEAKATGNQDFTGTYSYAEAYVAATQGWDDGQKKAKAFFEKLNISGKALRPEIYYDVVGDGGFDMGRVVEGTPESSMEWRDTQDCSGHGKIITMGVNVIASGGIPREILEVRGMATIALLDILEEAGYRVELTVLYNSDFGNHSYRGKGRLLMSVPLKTAESQAQEDEITFAIGHPSFMRRFCFSALGVCGEFGNKLQGHGCGLPSDSDLAEKFDIYSPMMMYGNSDFESVESAKKWILKVIAKYGVKIQEGEL